MKGENTFFRMMVAHRVLAIMPGLTHGTRLVGPAILAHYNTKTGQCDPSANRLVRLLGINRGTLFKAISQLTDGLGLFKRHTYGGRSHRNSYEPNWVRFEELNRSLGGLVKALCEQVPTGNGEQVLRGTTNENYLNDDRSSKPIRLVQPNESSKRLAGWSEPPASVIQGRLEGGLSRVPSHGLVAKNRAAAAWEKSLRVRLGPNQYGVAVELITEPMADAATEAELSRRGSGVYRVLADLQHAGLRSSP